MNIPISNNILDNFQLKNHDYLVSKDYYDLNSGEQEYRLYSYLSTFFDNVIILDIGTLNGRSAIALSHNENNKVLSYDIQNHINNNDHKIYSKTNILMQLQTDGLNNNAYAIVNYNEKMFTIPEKKCNIIKIGKMMKRNCKYYDIQYLEISYIFVYLN
jgi:hypothetical protein